MRMSVPETYKAVCLHPEDHTIHVETLPCPQYVVLICIFFSYLSLRRIEQPDDAIVKVILAGLCGSDLHGYRGHEHIPTKYARIVPSRFTDTHLLLTTTLLIPES